MRLHLLAGTREAREIASALAGMPGLAATASLAGATRRPAALALPTRVGGWGGRAAFRDWLAAEGVEALLDATHPFAARMATRAAEVAHEMRLRHARVLRPAWQAGPGDDWHEVEDERAAAALLPAGASVFLATGRQGAERFGRLPGRRIWLRQIDPPDGPFPFEAGDFVIGRPPFSVAEEVALFRRLAVDWLVVKNAGGDASRSKLDAARAIGIPVAMLRRPSPPRGMLLRDAAAAVAWVRELLA